jgi:hypothetical protein
MVIPKSILKNLTIKPYTLPSIPEGEFAARIADMLAETKDHKDIVHLVAGVMLQFYEIGFREGLHEAADRLTQIIKFGVRK